jgi:hypothetical protein
MRSRVQGRMIVSALAPILVLLAACGSPGHGRTTQATPPQRRTTQGTTPPPAAGQHEFVSKRYDFRVALAKDWSGHDAGVDWDGAELQGLDSPAFADLADPRTDRNFAAAAPPVAKGTRLATFRSAMVRAAPSACTESPTAGRTTLDGEPALAWTARCSDGYDVRKLAALHGQRGYMLLFASRTANDDAADRRIFESMRRSFRFGR